MESSVQTESDILKDIQAGKYRNCYLVYSRKSTDEPDNQKNSIKYQKAENTKFSRRENLCIPPITIPGFCMDGIISERHSGFTEDSEITITREGLVQYRIDRPKFQRLVQLLSRACFKGVICLCWDRLSRNKGDDTVVRKLMRKGIDVRFAFAKYENTSSGALHMDIDGMFAEHHSRVTSEKVRLATKSLRERGVVTYKAPIGYLNQGSMYHKPFDPDRAPIIKKLFELYGAGGWSLSDLARFANRHGLTTVPSRRRRTKSELLAEESEEIQINQLARPLTISHVHKILTNPFYIGKVLGNGKTYVLSASHEALIPEALFNAVQSMLRKNNVSLHFTDKLDLFFRGLVRCPNCGRVYTPYKQKGIQYFGARCAPFCINPKKSFNISFLENRVGTLITRLVFAETELAKIDIETSGNISLFEEKRLIRLELNDRRKKKIKEDITYLRTNKIDLLKSGVYTPEAFLQQENALNLELTELQDTEEASDEAMGAVVEDVLNLSELLKTCAAYYYLAKSHEKERIARIIFSELSLSGDTLGFKCRNGFRALESRLTAVCDPTTWLSEAVQLTNDIRESIRSLTLLLAEGNPAQPP